MISVENVASTYERRRTSNNSYTNLLRAKNSKLRMTLNFDDKYDGNVRMTKGCEVYCPPDLRKKLLDVAIEYFEDGVNGCDKFLDGLVIDRKEFVDE